MKNKLNINDTVNVDAQHKEWGTVYGPATVVEVFPRSVMVHVEGGKFGAGADVIVKKSEVRA